MNYTVRFIGLFVISIFLLSIGPIQASENRHLKSILTSIEQRTGYRFLYRESLIGRIKLSLRPDAELSELATALEKQGLALSIDSERKVAILTELKKTPEKAAPVSITVTDAASGSPLPFATITWKSGDETSGTVTDEKGHFVLHPHENVEEIRIGYMGYRTVFVQQKALLESENPVISLLPDVLESAAIIVHDDRYHSSPDTSGSRWANAQIAGYAGEKNVFRSLEAFSSVAPVVGLNKGLVIRGSNPDAFQVLLDGMTIFHQSHLFGLLDAFQGDALQAVSFHYAMIPAQYPSTPGGTMAFFTRSGSVNEAGGSGGLSNSSIKGLLELPFAKGRGSVLVAGRKSLLNELGWFNNAELISFGLDVNREHSSIPSTAIPSNERLLQNRTTDAEFSDVHAKAGFEVNSKTRLQAAVYAGSDDAQESADRYFQVSDSPLFNQRFRLFPVATTNVWRNQSWSIAGTHVRNPVTLFSLQAGGSTYRSSYLKGDYAYNTRQNGPGTPPAQPVNQAAIIDTFSNRNRVSEYKLNPHVDFRASENHSIQAGLAFYSYRVDYSEENVQRPKAVSIDRRSTQFDGYMQSDLRLNSGGVLQTGGRLHFYNAGNRVRFSPRIMLEHPVSILGTIKLGYSRNFQFLHRFGINQQISADVWSLTGKDEPITESDHVFAGIKTSLWKGATFSSDIYGKKTRNMRLHEITSVLLTDSALDSPRFFGNNGTSVGAEFMIDQQLTSSKLALSYVWSHTEIQNDRVNRGQPYPAEWDRTHQLKGRFEYQAWAGLRVFVSSTAVSGAPNYLNLFTQNTPQNQRFPDEPERLGWYFRTDAGLSGRTGTAQNGMEFSLSLFNILNRKNPWYRTVIQVLENDRNGRAEPRFYPVDVYDLGFRPSFDITFHF